MEKGRWEEGKLKVSCERGNGKGDVGEGSENEEEMGVFP